MNIYFTTITGRRDSNEDGHNIITNEGDVKLFGIYDGHGGGLVSKYLEKIIPEIYIKSKFKYPIDKSVHNEIFGHIQEKIISHEFGYSMGSTCLLNIMYKHKKEYHMNVINLGDSRFVCVYKNGNHKQITVDHKPDDEIEKKRIEKLGGKIHVEDGVHRIGDLSLARSFGDGDNAPYISHIPDTYYIKICEMTKYLVMGCDGLWDVVNNDELYEVLTKIKKTTENLAIGLAKECLNRGSTDNVSIIIIEIK